MPANRSIPWRRLAATGAVVFFAAFLVWLVMQSAQGDLDRSGKLASVVSMCVAIASLSLTATSLLVSLRPQPHVQSTTDLFKQLDQMADALAISVRAQWDTEERIRRIHDPFPLPVRWTNAPDDLTDHWENINGSPDRHNAIELSGHGDQIVGVFNRLPSGRLVVLGRAGAGKTILTSRFALTLLENRRLASDDPVPVIFSLGSWDPTATSLQDWLITQLSTNYPALAAKDSHGTTIAADLLTTGRIMPVLDGFDEITAGLRAEAIRAINAGLRPGDRLLLTSRPDEYANAVKDCDVLTAGAVIQLQDLTVEDLARYLPLTTRKTAGVRTKWHPIIDQMQDPDGLPASRTLASVLCSPLMVALARTIFSDTNRDPTELLDSQSDTNPADYRRAMEDHLLAGFVPAVYSYTPVGKQLSGTQTFDRDKAGYWLSFLANHLDNLGTHDLAWWQIIFTVPRIVVGLVAGFSILFMVGIVVALTGWGAAGHAGQTAWVTGGLMYAAIYAAIGGTVIGSGRAAQPNPLRMRLRIRGRLRQALRATAEEFFNWKGATWVSTCAGGGLTLGLAAWFSLEIEVSIVIGPAVGALIGVIIWIIVAFVRCLGTAIDLAENISPLDLLRIDRWTAISQGSMVGLGSSIVIWAGIWLAFEGSGLPYELIFGRVCGQPCSSPRWAASCSGYLCSASGAAG